jgi:hypothetical protein
VTLANSGTVTLRPGSDLLRLGNGALIQNNNGGVFELLNDGQVFADAGNFGSFTNAAGATLRKSSGGTSIWNAALTNNGTVQVQDGTFRLTGGGSGAGAFVNAGVLQFESNYTLNAGASLLGAGTYRLLSSTLAVNGTLGAPLFELNGGTLAVGNGGAYNIGNGQRFTWSNGTITGAGTTDVLNGGLLTLLGNNSNNLIGTVLRNSGTINLAAGADLLRLGNSAVVQNNSGGLFELSGDGQIFADAGNFGSFVNAAGATVRKSGGPGVSVFNAPLTNNGSVQVQSGTLQLSGTGGGSGLFDISTGALVNFTSNYNAADGAAFSGSGLARLSGGTLGIAGTVTADRFEQVGGTIAIGAGSNFAFGAGDVFDLRAGVITGGILNIGSGAVLNIFGGNSVNLIGTALANSGIVTLTSGSDLLRLGNGAVIQNNNGGLFDLQNAGQVFADAGNFGSFTNAAGATLRKSSSGTSIWNAALTNEGAVEVQNGTFHLTGGGSGSGSFDVAADALLLFNSNYILNSGATLAAPAFTGW